MLNKSKIPFRSITAIVAGLLCIFFFTAGNALAQPRHDGRDNRGHYDKYDRYDKRDGHGKTVYNLPHGYRTVVVKGHRHYYHNGVYYRQGPSGYVVVQAPIGAVIPALPIGFQAVIRAGSTYFTFGGVYYRRVPTGYVVVEAPPAQVVYGGGPVVAPYPVGGSVYVTTSLLNVRSGPGGGYGVIRQVQRGNVLVIQGNSSGWLYVQLPWGGFGWVSSQFIAPVGPVPAG